MFFSDRGMPGSKIMASNLEGVSSIDFRPARGVAMN